MISSSEMDRFDMIRWVPMKGVRSLFSGVSFPGRIQFPTAATGKRCLLGRRVNELLEAAAGRRIRQRSGL